MSAHLRPLKISCDDPGCMRTAREELRNTSNAVLGRYCASHAKRRLREALDGERDHPASPRDYPINLPRSAEGYVAPNQA